MATLQVLLQHIVLTNSDILIRCTESMLLGVLPERWAVMVTLFHRGCRVRVALSGKNVACDTQVGLKAG